MLQRINTEILTPRGRIVDICNIDMFDNNNIKKTECNGGNLHKIQVCNVRKINQ